MRQSDITSQPNCVHEYIRMNEINSLSLPCFPILLCLCVWIISKTTNIWPAKEQLLCQCGIIIPKTTCIWPVNETIRDHMTQQCPWIYKNEWNKLVISPFFSYTIVSMWYNDSKTTCIWPVNETIRDHMTQQCPWIYKNEWNKLVISALFSYTIVSMWYNDSKTTCIWPVNSDNQRSQANITVSMNI